MAEAAEASGTRSLARARDSNRHRRSSSIRQWRLPALAAGAEERRKAAAEAAACLAMAGRGGLLRRPELYYRSYARSSIGHPRDLQHGNEIVQAPGTWFSATR